MASRPESGAPEATWRDLTHVSFDVDGTLDSSSPRPAEIFRSALAKREHILGREPIRRNLRSPDLIMTLIQPVVREPETEFCRSVSARLVEPLGLRPDDTALDDIHASFRREIVYRPFPEAVQMLKALKTKGYWTGVISDFSHRLPEVLEQLGLAAYFDTVTYSFGMGAEKPRPKIRRAAVARGYGPGARAHGR